MNKNNKNSNNDDNNRQQRQTTSTATDKNNNRRRRPPPPQQQQQQRQQITTPTTSTTTTTTLLSTTKSQNLKSNCWLSSMCYLDTVNKLVCKHYLATFFCYVNPVYINHVIQILNTNHQTGTFLNTVEKLLLLHKSLSQQRKSHSPNLHI